MPSPRTKRKTQPWVGRMSANSDGLELDPELGQHRLEGDVEQPREGDPGGGLWGRESFRQEA